MVEDESILALFLCQKLRTFGFTTPEHAMTGEEAIEKALLFRPDLILMDIRLSGTMDGITAVSHIHQRLDVPVVYVTAYSDPATLQRAQETKYFGFLEKPVDDYILRSTIEAALRQHRAGQEGNAPEGGL